MSDDYACGGSRNKKSDKAKTKKGMPYKAGGRFRAISTVSEVDNSSKKVVNVKKKKNKKDKQAKKKK
ncbi:MAG: hypothetical protein PF542_04905 [Nanoarchaeota archaeon]|jgi:hypothetical protein|nr:hypothetical protein [Nanoarchaeota archaeon]